MSDPSLAFRHRLPLHYYVRFQGLPGVCFGDGPDPGLSGVTYAPSLRIADQIISTEIKTGEAIGSGRALDIVLDADTLSASGVYSSHFANPTKITSLIAALPIADTTIPTSGTSEFPSSGSFYWGHEKIAYSGKTSVNFTGCTRGAGVTSTGINYATAAPHGVSGAWSLITDRPVLWRGRLVEVWAVAATPEGDLLGAPFTVSDASFRIWIGHVDGQPQIIPTGISVRALPAERAADKKYGWGQAWKIASEGRWYDRTIYWPSGGKIRVEDVEETGGAFSFETFTVEPLSGVAVDHLSRVLSVFDLWVLVAAKLQALGGITTCRALKNEEAGKICLEIKPNGKDLKGAQFMPEGSASRMWPAIGGSTNWYAEGAGEIPIVNIEPFEDHPSPIARGGFLVTQPEEGSDQIYAGAPIAGQMVTYKRGDVQFVAGVLRVMPLASQWSSSDYFVVLGDLLYGEASSNTSEVKEVNECLFVSGQNTLGDVWSKLLQTSGGAVLSSATAGAFGSSDLLPIGWGARIPSDWIEATFASSNLEKAVSPFVAFDMDANSLFIDAIALKIAVTQRFESGTTKISAQPVFSPQEADTSNEIATSKLLTTPIRIGPRAKPPNVIEVEFFSESKPKLTIRNQLRIQAEGGIKKQSFKVPDHWQGPRLASLVQAITTPDQILSNVYIYDLALGPESVWNLNPGDKLKITGTHYAFADFTTGGHRGSSVSGRVLGVTRNLDGSGGTVRLAVWAAIVADYYCPDSEISSINAGTKTITLPSGRAEWFWVGDTSKVLLYDPGNENTRAETNRMASSTGNDITFLAPLPSWLTTSHRITFAATADAPDRQKLWAHTDDGGSL